MIYFSINAIKNVDLLSSNILMKLRTFKIRDLAIERRTFKTQGFVSSKLNEITYPYLI